MAQEQLASAPRMVRLLQSSRLARTALAAVLATAGVPATFAQEAASSAAPPDQLQEVTVTGSRIVRRDFNSDSPIVTVSSNVLTQTSEVGVDQALNKLPQFVPGAGQFTSATDVQATPTNAPGIATINLRGLGSNRTLVLLDGRRTQPNNASLVVDLNTLPASAIDNVEIITGGAGATYGADAVAGVVNFKLKKNYQGVTVDVQSGETFRGDGAQTQISALLGSNFADNRGNAMLGLTYSDRHGVNTIDRSFFNQANLDPGTPGTDGFPAFGGVSASLQATGVLGNPTNPANNFSQAALDALFGSRGYAAGDVKPGANLYFNTGATTAGASVFSNVQGAVDGKPAPGYNGATYPQWKYLTNGSISSNTPAGLLSLPLTRYSLFTDAHFDINSHVTAYMEGHFDDNETVTRSGAAVPAVNQWSVTIPVDAGHPVPADLAALLGSRPLPTAPWSLLKELSYMGPESLDTQTTTYEVLAGLRGDLGVKDWTFDIFASHGKTSIQTAYSGFVDYGRYQTLINLPNYGAGADFNYGRTGLLAHCTSGLNPFTNTTPSQDCINIISAPISTQTTLKQDQIELDIQGALANVPAGELRYAIGADYRSDSSLYAPDPSLSTSNISSLTVGLFDVSRTQGSINVKEGYLELLAPIVKDLPGIKALSLDAGYRYSDYSTATGGVSTWKVTMDWAVNNYVTIRGGRQSANRAPNVAELFQPAVFSTVPWPDHDPCSNITRAPYGNVASNPDRAKVQALCTALAGGFPITSSYVGNNPTYFPLGRDLTAGNPNLQPEQAKTWTAGTVLRSPFDADALRRLTLTLDYYNVTINSAIAPTTTQVAYQECFNGFGTNPTYDPNNQFCKLLLRSSLNGFWLNTNALYGNLGQIKTSGIDAQLDWSADAPGLFGLPGTIFANVNGNYLKAYDVQQVAGGPTIHYAGTIGAPIGPSPPYGAQFRWKTYTTFGYGIGPATATFGWRHLPSTKNYGLATNPLSTALPAGHYDQVDFAGRWVFSPHFEARVGIDNLFDRQPNIVGAIPGTTNAAGVTDPAGSYDVLGRRFYVGVTGKF